MCRGFFTLGDGCWLPNSLRRSIFSTAGSFGNATGPQRSPSGGQTIGRTSQLSGIGVDFPGDCDGFCDGFFGQEG